jgi:hypothetical protein
VFAVAFIVLFLVLSVVFSWPRNQRRILLQRLLIGIGLVAVPVCFAVQDRRAMARTIGANQFGHLRFLLALGADGSGENSVLLHATLGGVQKPGSIEMMRFLLDQGADPNAADSRSTWGERISITPIMAAVTYTGQTDDDERLAMLRLLLERGADPDRENSRALFRAVGADSVPMVDLLLEHGGNMHVQNEYGRGQFFSVNTRELARYLVDHGVRLNVRNQWGKRRYSKWHRVRMLMSSHI